MPAPKLDHRTREQRRAEYQRMKARKPTPPADPIEQLSDVDAAYIAGIIDGEGCIRIARVGPKKLTYYPAISVGMTYRPVIEWLQSKINPGSIKICEHRGASRDVKWKPCHLVRIHGKRAKLLCSVLLPFLKVKKAHAELVMRFPGEGRSGPGNPITEEMAAERLALRNQMTALNARG